MRTIEHVSNRERLKYLFNKRETTTNGIMSWWYFRKLDKFMLSLSYDELKKLQRSFANSHYVDADKRIINNRIHQLVKQYIRLSQGGSLFSTLICSLDDTKTIS